MYTISRPRRGFGKKSVEKLKNAAAQNNCSFFKALGKQIEDGHITQKNVIEYYNAKVVFEVGDKVRHKVFGIGEIVKVDKVTQTYEIQFENIRGMRRLMFRAELGRC